MAPSEPIGRPQFEEIIRHYFIPSRVQLIMLAYRLAKYGHRGQLREDGSRYFDHPRAASMVLLQHKLFDHEIIIAALLHDTMEDTYILTWEDIEAIFGSRVCTLVKLVTKEPGLPKEDYLPRLLNGTPDAWIIKLADRIHNLSTLEHCSAEKRRRQIAETRAQYLPLCEKLAGEPEYHELGLWFLREISALCAGLERGLPAESTV